MQGFSPERGGEPQRVWNRGDTGPDSASTCGRINFWELGG